MSATLDLVYAFTGRWLTQKSPANRVPSHGTTLYASSFAIDFVPVDESGRTAPLTLASLVHPEPAARFPGFGRPVLAPVEGIIVAVHDSEPDHEAFRGLPSVRYSYVEVGLEFCNTTLRARDARQISGKAFSGHYGRLTRYFLTENWPIMDQMLQAPYVSTYIREEIVRAKAEGWDWAAEHERLIA